MARQVTGGLVSAIVVGMLALAAPSPARAQARAATTKPTTRPAKQAADGTITFLAIDADVRGQKARVEKKGNNPHNIGYWTNKDDHAIWRATVDRPGRFVVEVEYSLDKKADGAEYVIELNDQTIHVKPAVTGTWLDFTTIKVGEVELPKGDLKLVVRGEKKPGQAVLDLRGVRLIPAARG